MRRFLTDDLIETGARAIYEEKTGLLNWDRCASQDYWRLIARAGISAIVPQLVERCAEVPEREGNLLALAADTDTSENQRFVTKLCADTLLTAARDIRALQPTTQDTDKIAEDGIAAKVAALEADNARLRKRTAMAMGVGDGSGQLFVHGDYESIKSAQALVSRFEELAAEKTRLLDALQKINERGSPGPERTFDVAIADLDYIVDRARYAIRSVDPKEAD